MTQPGGAPAGGDPNAGRGTPRIVTPPPVGGQTQTTPSTTTTSTTAPRPTVTASSPNQSMLCLSTDTSRPEDVSWSSTNATTVDVGPLTGQQPSGQLTADVPCNSGNPAVITVTARGPGGTASTTVSWNVIVGQN